ncbi:hypothetical protein [Thermofilum sp.]|jgi:hypothetical protein|uniref:hypothetical protein n=1 Tax=Thermofilum sp. TaxID=1961369 RepID=UPI00258AF3F2|nr:hypothetical protein [Thermofilum sp.]
MEIRIGKMSFPIVSVGIGDNDDILIIFKNGDKLFAQSVNTRSIAQLKFKDGKIMWGNKTVKFI